MSSIYVYGTTWCGYTRQQVSELKDELQTHGANVEQSMHFVECDKKDNAVCKGLSGYPLALVHSDDKPPTAAEVAQAPLGKRAAAELVQEWYTACDTELPTDKHDAKKLAPGAGKHDAKTPAPGAGIYVYGTTWCGYTRQQVSEVKDELQAQGLDADNLHFVECDKQDHAVCKGLSGYPLALVHGETPPTAAEVAQAPLGKRPAADLVQELHAHKGVNGHDDKKHDKKHDKTTEPGIYVYGAKWCGYTNQQVDEVKTALQAAGQESSLLHFINCEKQPDNKVCASLTGFPLALVHSGPPTPAEAAKVQIGKQSASQLVADLQAAL